MIYGAGTLGRMMATRFQNDPNLGYHVIGFLDDDPRKIGRVISGIRVLGDRTDISQVFRAQDFRELIVAINAPQGSMLRDVVQACRKLGIRPRMCPGLSSVRQGQPLELIRNIDLSDLLNRPTRDLDMAPVRELIRNKRVLVTGAGGSIGSEIARQVLGFQPAKLLLLDHSEYNLYQIDHELRVSTRDGFVVPLLQDIKDVHALETVFDEHRPEVVFHAAAYKHVHLVEANPASAILNNIQGTRNLLDAASRHGVDNFVLISTDKAVNPAGTMGATKRVCEMLVAEYGRKSRGKYTAVRFGNVLGSSGSLIPLLRKQVENGEAVTITHEDMTRYFMLIPEAVSLVLRAATIGQSGDILLLRMGDPVRIVDIARSLIALMGKTEEQVPIVFTGLRPGEKLFEELYICGNEINTEDPDILIVPRGDGAYEAAHDIDTEVERIVGLAARKESDAVFALNALVNSNYPKHEVGPEGQAVVLSWKNDKSGQA